MSDVAAAREAVERWFAAQPDLEVEAVDRGEGAWYTVLSGERKRTIPVFLELGAHTLQLHSFFMRAPDENEADIYRYLLSRNTRSYVLRFAVSDAGDVVITGVVPLAALDDAELDRLLGQLLALADGTYDQALRIGFASYIEHEQSWRERVGLGRNPIT